MQASGQASTVSGAGCGPSTSASFAWFDRDTSSWKTWQRSLFGGWDEFSETWPHAGSMRSGTCCRRVPLVPRTAGKGSGLLPTPVTYDSTPGGPNNHYKGLGWHARHQWPTPNTVGYRSDGELKLLAKSADDRQEFLGLSHRVANSKREKYWPTPRASDSKGSGPRGSKSKIHLEDRGYLTGTVATEACGQLNPMWVEWLMGFPGGWTDLGDSETPSCRKSRNGSAAAGWTRRRGTRMESPLWPHQQRGIEEFMRLVAQGEKAICLTSPTGGGKSRMTTELIKRFDSAVLYTNRKLLTEQLIQVLQGNEMYFGVRASGFDDHLRLNEPVQIASMPTEYSRCFGKQANRSLHRAKIVVVDECHMQRGRNAQRIMREHLADGAVVCGMTATPTDIFGQPYAKLVVAGVNSELRTCDAHLPCNVFAPDEPDLHKIKATPTGEYDDGSEIVTVWMPAVVGRVIGHYRTLNPGGLPAVCCCPSVATAAWMAEQFTQNGIPSASLDGEEICIDGRRIKSGRCARAHLMRRLDDGSIKVITFRYVLREAWDFPRLYHMILATPIGSITSYLQVVGRVLRKHETLDHVVLQDHGGNYHRHGSPNADQDWQNTWQLDPRIITELRAERLREKKELEPITCPKCKAVRLRGMTCHHCGHVSPKKTREVLQHDGTLKAVEGDIFKPRRVAQKPDTQRIWEQCYHRCHNSGQTFRQAEGLFFYENHYYPPRTLPLMPTKDTDWFRKIKHVARGALQ